MGVLVVLASACGRDNPGFKLKDADDGVAESETTASSVTGMTTGPGTSAPTTSTSMPTTVEPETSSTFSSTTMDIEPMTSSTSTGDVTTGGPKWDDQCEAQGVEPVTQDANMQIDTFFMYEDPSFGKGCDIGGGDFVDEAYCIDLNFASSERQQVFNYPLAPEPPMPEEDHTRKVFVAVFEATLEDLKTKSPVPDDAVLDIKLAVSFKYIAGEAPLNFELKKMVAKGWKAGSGLAETCKEGEASFGCLACSGLEEEECAAPGKPWPEPGTPYAADADPIVVFPVNKPTLAEQVVIPVAAGAAAKAEYLELQGQHPGYVVVPPLGLADNKMEIYTSDAMPEPRAPRLIVRYCPDPAGL